MDSLSQVKNLHTYEQMTCEYVKRGGRRWRLHTCDFPRNLSILLSLKPSIPLCIPKPTCSHQAQRCA